MSYRFDTPLIAGAYVFGNSGLGVRGSAVPSTGDNGAGYLYNDLSLPDDANKEVRGLIVTPPSAGDFFAYEDSSFEFSGAPDGTYSFTYWLFVDGADLGIASVTLNVGSVGVTITCSLGTASASGYAANISQVYTLVCNLGLALAEGYQVSVSQSAAISCQTGTASAIGYQGTIQVAGTTVIDCASGTASAVGYQAAVLSPEQIAGALGQASAVGYQATILVSSTGTGPLSDEDIQRIVAALPSAADIAAAVVAALNATTGTRTIGQHLQIQTTVLAGETSGAGTPHIAFIDGSVTVEADVPVVGQTGDRKNVVIGGV